MNDSPRTTLVSGTRHTEAANVARRVMGGRALEDWGCSSMPYWIYAVSRENVPNETVDESVRLGFLVRVSNRMVPTDKALAELKPWEFLQGEQDVQ